MRRKRRKGHGWTKRRLPDTWPARAILEENSREYHILWEPVSGESECEQTWEPKHYADASLVAEWKQRQRAIVEMHTDSGESVEDLQPADQGKTEYDGKVEFRGSSLKSTEQHSASDGNIRGFCDHLHQQDTFDEVLSCPSRQAASTVNSEQASWDHSGTDLPHTNHDPECDSSEDKGHGGHVPRPGTRICTLLLPDSPALPGYVTHERINSIQNESESPQTSSAAKVLGDDKHSSSGKLASARHQLRNLLYRHKKERPGRRKMKAPMSPPSSEHC